MLDGQPVEKGRSHNIFRRDVDDMELVKMYSLDPSIAYTPGINNAIVNAQHKNTYDTLIKQGTPEREAKATASKARADANKRVSAALKVMAK